MAKWFGKVRSSIKDRRNSTCFDHQYKMLNFICKDCDNVPICARCLSTTHEKHAVVEIYELIPSAKQKIGSYIKSAEKVVIPRLKKEKDLVDKERSKTEKRFADITDKIQTITNKMVKSCKELKHQNDAVLQKHKAELDSKIQSLQVEIQNRNELILSGTPLQIYEIAKLSLDEKDNCTQSPLPGEDLKPDFLIENLESLREQLSAFTTRQLQQTKTPQPGVTEAVKKEVSANGTPTNTSSGSWDLSDVRYQGGKKTDSTFIPQDIGNDRNFVENRNEPVNGTPTNTSSGSWDLSDVSYQEGSRTHSTFIQQDIGNEKRNEPGNETIALSRYSNCDKGNDRYQSDRIYPTISELDIGNDNFVVDRNKPGNETIIYSRHSVSDERDDRYGRDHRIEPMNIQQDIRKDENVVMETNKQENETTTNISYSGLDLHDDRTEPTLIQQDIGNDINAVEEKNNPEYAIVRFTYIADNPDKLSLKKNEVVTILEKDTGDSGWWKGELDGKIGMFPNNFVELKP